MSEQEPTTEAPEDEPTEGEPTERDPIEEEPTGPNPAEEEPADPDPIGEESTATEGFGDDVPAGSDDQAGREALERAIAENPEAVAEFVDRLDAVNELLDVVELGTAAMDDRMVTELSGTGTTLAAAGDGLATDGTVRLSESVGHHGDDLTEALETLVELQRSGTLDDLADLADLAALATGAMDDRMVMELAGTGSRLGELADAASDPDTARNLESTLAALGAADDAEPRGAIGLLRATRDPEVKQGLGFLVAVAKGIGRDLDDRDAGGE